MTNDELSPLEKRVRWLAVYGAAVVLEVSKTRFDGPAERNDARWEGIIEEAEGIADLSEKAIERRAARKDR